MPIGWADFDSVGPSSGYRPFMGVNLSGGAALQALTVQQSGDTQEWHLALVKELCEQCCCNGQAAIHQLCCYTDMLECVRVESPAVSLFTLTMHPQMCSVT